MALSAEERKVRTKNRLAGRQIELRKKMKESLERYDAVFGRSLSVKELKDFLAEEAKQEKWRFLRDRLGLLSDTDIKFLREIIDSGTALSAEAPPEIDDELEDLVEDEGEETEE